MLTPHSFSMVGRATLATLLGALSLSAQQHVDVPPSLALRHRIEVAASYGLSAWPRGAARNGLATDTLVPGWSAGALQAERGLVQRTFRRAGEAQAAPSFVLETCVEDSAELADGRLVDWLAGLQSVEAAPSLATLGLALGDTGFAGRSGAGADTLAWIAFVRGNVYVRVSACDPVREPALDLGAIAAVLDQAVRAAPELEAGGAPPRPRIESLALARASVVAGTAVRVDVSVTDPAGGTPHLEWTVGGPGQGYVERAKDGSWQLHTTGPGAITLILEATASTGTWARFESHLDVLDD